MLHRCTASRRCPRRAVSGAGVHRPDGRWAPILVSMPPEGPREPSAPTRRLLAVPCVLTPRMPQGRGVRSTCKHESEHQRLEGANARRAYGPTACSRFEVVRRDQVVIPGRKPASCRSQRSRSPEATLRRQPNLRASTGWCRCSTKHLLQRTSGSELRHVRRSRSGEPKGSTSRWVQWPIAAVALGQETT